MANIGVSNSSGGLKVVAYPGDQKILIAMSMDKDIVQQNNLAGFAIWRRPAGGAETELANRIGFDYGVNANTTSATRKWTDSSKAPFQKFRWVDVPPDGFNGPIAYRVKALYFKNAQGFETHEGPEVSVTVKPVGQTHARFKAHFTRGYIASQAYADRFDNADIRPKGAKSPSFDTKPFEKQYEWLGADARVALFDFIADCEKDTTAKVDVFAYDLDEPDVIAAICRLGKQHRLRAVLDNAPLHSKTSAKGGKPVEIGAAKMIMDATGHSASNKRVVQGHFNRFQHNKVFIKRDASGKARRVLFGSMNFSVRGLYVQANNIIVVDDEKTAGMFADAFDNAFENGVKASAFCSAPVAAGYEAMSAQNSLDLPKFSLALSPHKSAKASLGPMADRIQRAKSSVFYAVMQPTGTGNVLGALRKIAGNPVVFSYGTVETDKGLAVQSPDGAMGDVTGFAALDKNVPPPFNKEFNGGMGMHIHDKFVVVDFNADDPTVFTGSSNLAEGGEQANGDSLAMISDPDIAAMFAIEAVAMFDHYHFRKRMRDTKPSGQPFTLWYPGKPGAATPWWTSSFDEKRIQMRDRCLFAQEPLPTGLQAVKNVDWTVAALTKKQPGAGGGKTAAKPAPAGRSAAKKSAAKKTAGKAKPKKVAAKKRPAKKSVRRPAKKVAAKKRARKTARRAPARKATRRRAR